VADRREFIGALLALGLTGCRRGGLPIQPPSQEPAPPAKLPSPTLPSASPGLLPATHPEEVQPPARSPRPDMLTGIRRIKPPGPELIEVAGRSPARMVRAGLAAIGGMRLFVDRGSRVVITPNFAWARPAGTGITTLPELVREVILMCQEAGAREIICLDNTTDPVPRAYRINGAEEAVAGTRCRLFSPSSAEQYVCVGDFERGKLHATRLSWQAVPQALLRCDVLISMPVFKHHREVHVTGAIKKLMGCIWRREIYHRVNLEGCIAELGSILRPTLVVTDALRILASNGPDGPGRVIQPGRVLVGTDPVLADAHACGYLSVDPGKVGYLVQAARLGAGSPERAESRTERIGVRG